MKLTIILLFCFLLSLSVIVYSDQQILSTRDSLPVVNAELKLDESFKTNLFTGSFMYDYKIEVPPGTNGLQPELSLFYASQKSTTPPSVVGTGWDLTQSYIERDTNSSFNNTANDRFILVLNGNSYDLIFVSSEKQFHTEIEPGLRIENVTTTTNKKGMYWNVKTSDGINYRFGFNNNSESVYEKVNYTVIWYLDLVVDTYNNSIFYNYAEDPYTNDANATYLMNISYNNDRTRIIYLEYENSDRGDIWKIYQNGNSIRHSRRLNRIIIAANGDFVRKYVIEYKNSDSITRNYISSIKQYGSDNATNLPETSFSYSPVIDGFTDTSVWYPPVCMASTSGHGDQGTRLEDLNGDGLIDIIKALSTNGPCNIPDQLKAFINNGSGWVENSSWYPPICLYSYFTGDVGTRVVDVNGDGRADIIKGYNTNTECDTVSEADAYINNGSGWTRNTSWNPPICFYSSMHGDEGVQLVDINGDGLVDIVRGYTNVGGSCESPDNATAFINNGTGWIRNNTWKPPVCFSSAGMEDEGTRFADVNGDGLVDIIRGRDSVGPCENPNIQSAYINTGNGWVQSSVWNPPLCFVSDPGNDEGTRLADINGDNRIDIVRGRIQSSNNNCQLPDFLQAYLNNGNGWTLNTTWYPPTCFTQYGVQFPDMGTRLADINGDGLVDIIRGLEHYDCNPPDERKAFINNGNQSYLLREIKNGFGGSLTVDYKKSTSFDNTGSDDVGDLGFNLWVVSSITQRNGVNGSAGVNATYTYNYSGGKYEYQDHEFRGFSFAQEIRPDGTKINHYFHQDKARTGREYKTDVFDANNNLYQQKEYIWNYTANETSGGTVYVTELREENTSTYDGLDGEPRIAKTTYNYDQFGNVLERVQHSDTNSTGDEKYERFNYTYNTTTWIIDKPKSYALIAADNITKLREVNYTYDNRTYGDPPSRGSVTRTDELEGKTTTYDYNDHGNVISTIDPNGHETRYTYGAIDTTFTFPDQQINAKGQTIKYTYDLGLGKPTSVNDSNGFVTYYIYDTFGRISKEIRPYDSENYPTKQYTYDIDGTAPEKIIVKTRETNSTNNTFDSYQFYDGFSVYILSKSEAVNTKQIAVDTLYDKVTRPEIKSNPHLVAFEENYTEPDLSINRTNFTYDPIDRISIIINPDKTTKSFNYTKWNVTVTNELGKQQLQVLDAYGRITKVIEYNGDETYITTYTYDAAGNLIKITDNEGNNFTFAYDLLGRKTGMSDPDMGVWNYTYDAVGNLIKQNDNRNITVDFAYDELNRLTRKNSSLEFYNYTYDTQLNGTLSSVKSINNTINYTYDARLRKISQMKNITDNITMINFTYDSLDRITQILLPNSDSINLTYNNQNQIESISGVISNIDYNELNNILGRAYNNSVISNFTYSPDNLRLRRIRTSSQTATLQELNYTYDNTSNVLAISDLVNSITLNLTYDDLHRLLIAKRSDSGRTHHNFTINYTYSSIGNIVKINYNNNGTNVTYLYSGQPVHMPYQVLQTGPILQVTGLQLLNTSGTVKIYEFDIKNNGNTNLPSISWVFYTGEAIINSTIGINLTANESIFVFVEYNYTNTSLSDKVIAVAYKNSLFDIEGLNDFNPDPNITSTLTYDTNGNLIQDSKFYYEYNNFNQLKKVRNGNATGTIIEDYLYDHNGNRILKRASNETTFYISDNFVRVSNTTGIFDTVYYYDKQSLIARKDPDGSKFYYHPDHLGSTTFVTNQSGIVVEETNYYPYGLPIYDAQSRYLYTGKELDRSTGLEYYGARYYSPELGRFVEPDSIVQTLYNPQNLNRYSYTLNSPYRYTDPTGKYADTIVDAGSLIYDISEFQKEPNLLNTVALIADVGTTVLPFVAGGGMIVRAGAHVGDIAEKGIDAGKAADVAGQVGKQAENIPDAMKSQGDFERALQDAVNKANPGTPTDRISGINAHSNVKELMTQQGVPDTILEQSRVGGEIKPYGTLGSSRADALWQQGNQLTIYDYKFGNAQMGSAQYFKIMENFGKEGLSTKVKVLKPNQAIKTVKKP